MSRSVVCHHLIKEIILIVGIRDRLHDRRDSCSCFYRWTLRKARGRRNQLLLSVRDLANDRSGFRACRLRHDTKFRSDLFSLVLAWVSIRTYAQRGFLHPRTEVVEKHWSCPGLSIQDDRGDRSRRKTVRAFSWAPGGSKCFSFHRWRPLRTRHLARAGPDRRYN